MLENVVALANGQGNGDVNSLQLSIAGAIVFVGCMAMLACRHQGKLGTGVFFALMMAVLVGVESNRAISSYFTGSTRWLLLVGGCVVFFGLQLLLLFRRKRP